MSGASGHQGDKLGFYGSHPVPIPEWYINATTIDSKVEVSVALLRFLRAALGWYAWHEHHDEKDGEWMMKPGVAVARDAMTISKALQSRQLH